MQASLLACEGLSGVCLVPTVASKKMMPKQSSKQAEGRERGSSPDVLVVVIKQNCSFQLRIHKNFICEQCCGAFRSSYHLKRHILIHTDRLLRHKRMCQGCQTKGPEAQLLL
ncbi:UNVERIFIED_CONTAM: hypothetical protein H355_004559 [Colinus virginianus]|uniref:C2H2-type domain-containing protein n=1 Tax=Callipepla squamata TaxID=9009 RepID=A0A226MJY5_CALSU|nr:hypothetical protein ASZ78_002847 [Callipepla squamata]OXB79016.1 hypothetical protein H355_004559 [Colinus virginianus]